MRVNSGETTQKHRWPRKERLFFPTLLGAALSDGWKELLLISPYLG